MSEGIRDRLHRTWGRVYRSVFRIGWPRTRQQRLAAMLSSLVLHVHPTRKTQPALVAALAPVLGPRWWSLRKALKDGPDAVVVWLEKLKPRPGKYD